MADRSASVPINLSDVKRREARVKFFRRSKFKVTGRAFRCLAELSIYFYLTKEFDDDDDDDDES